MNHVSVESHARHLPQLAIATSNPGKFRELVALIGHAARVLSLRDLGIRLPEESGATFQANALAKAQFVSVRSGLLTMADDSGLEVDALNGAPGIRSARFAGAHAHGEKNRSLLLRRLTDVPHADRTARFVCAIALADRHGRTHTATGECCGSIACRESGSGGFGYDPVFLLESGRTMADLTFEEKNAVSHRGIALARTLPVLLRSLQLGELTAESPVDRQGET